MNIPRPEYPRPQFVRENWLNLNGAWQFSFDEPSFDREIIVPFAYQSRLSGLGITERHDVVWYRRSFAVPEDWREKTVLLHFGAVDYSCGVWVNDIHVGGHEGGHVDFTLDITHALHHGENTVTVRAADVLSDLTLPRGKQYWQAEPKSIFYTPTTGIWQTVWLECVEKDHILRVDITPDLDRREAAFDYALSGEGLELEIELTFQGNWWQGADGSAPLQRQDCSSPGQRAAGEDNFTSVCAWSPEKPRLFDVTYRLYRGQALVDTVSSYFGLRKISIEDGVVLLNNYPYYQKLLLDQGYWPDSS